MRSDAFDRERVISSCVGTDLWVGEVGSGRPLVLCDGLGCDGFIWKYIVPQFGADHHVVRWHYRGHGLSEVPSDPAALSVEGFADDLLRLLEELELEGALIAGHSLGVQVLLEAALRADKEVARRRIAGLLPICGASGRPLHSFKNTSAGIVLLPKVRNLIRRNPEAFRTFWRTLLPSRLTLEFARWTEINARLMKPGDLAPYLDRLAKMDPDVFFTTLANAAYHETGWRLESLHVPTLVVAAERDTFTPLQRSITMQRRIPDAELFVLPQATHTGPLEWPELLELRIRRFIRERVDPSSTA